MQVTLLIISFGVLVTGESENVFCPNDKSHLAPIRLRKDLLCGYEKSERPVLNHKDPVAVVMKMIVKGFDYNIHDNTFTVDCWMAMFWKDAHLTWNPDDYESIKSIHLSDSDIWMPDISVYNRKSQGGSPTAIDWATCIVSNDGQVICVPPAQYSAVCMSDMTKFPLDTHNCTIRLGSWVHSGEEIDLRVNKKSITIEDLVSSGEWGMLDYAVVKHPGKFKCCPNNTYPSVNFSFKIKRITGSHTASIILPSLALVITTLTSLWITPSSPCRLNLCYMNTLCEFIHLQFVSWMVPTNTETVPVMLLFARDSLLLSAFVIVFSVILKNLVASQTPAPGWVSATVSVLTAFKPGQFIFLDDTSVKAIAKTEDEEDGTAIINGQDRNPQAKDWLLFAKILDRLCFAVFVIAYVVMFVGFIP